MSILVSLSGGLDSVCLLRLLNYCKPRLGFELKAVHFNHGLREEESEYDYMFCTDLCRSLSVDLFSINLQMDKRQSNLQARARDQRRNHYGNWKSCGLNHFVALGHHKDDFVESFFIGAHQGRLDERLLPLKFIDFKTQLLRPLVAYSKYELFNLAVRNGWAWRDDSTNVCTDYLRNFYRNELLKDANIAESVIQFTNFFSSLDSELRTWIKFQIKLFEKRGNYLSRNVCSEWEASRFRDFWLAVLQKNYPQFLKSFDAKRLHQVRIKKFRGNRRFQIGFISSKSVNKLCLIETLRGYHLEIEEV